MDGDRSRRGEGTMDMYRFFNADDELLYVGISLHAAKRASEHRKDKPWWPNVARMEIQHLDVGTRAEAEELERQAIVEERPIHNVRHMLPTPSASSDDVGVVEFQFPYKMSELWEAQAAIDALGRRFDELQRKGQPNVPDRAEFLALVNAIARSVIYGDMCSKCRGLEQDINYPIALERTGPDGCRCYYLCHTCGHVYTCSWTTDLAVLAQMP